MKRLVILILLSFSFLVSFSQSFVGRTIKQVNLRESSSTDASILKSLPKGTQIFIVSLDAENDFYNVLDIASNTEGYVHKDFVKVGKQVKENSEGLFTENGESSNYDADLEIFNNTLHTLTLKLNSNNYSFSPHEKRTISISPGYCSYRASAPNVMPYIGSESLKSNRSYSWEFFIVTKKRY